MGLDSYIHCTRRAIPKKGSRKVDLDSLHYDFKDLDTDEYGCANSIGITTSEMYFRKANQLHGWFVGNCNDGVDDCKDVYVSDEKLLELYEICSEILKRADGLTMFLDEKVEEDLKKDGAKYKKTIKFNGRSPKTMWNKIDLCDYCFKDEDFISHCKEVLPPQEGFFFGDYEIDGSYILSIVKFVILYKRLSAKLKKWQREGVPYHLCYSASW